MRVGDGRVHSHESVFSSRGCDLAGRHLIGAASQRSFCRYLRDSAGVSVSVGAACNSAWADVRGDAHRGVIKD
jgi:hypothetical protein